MSFTSIQKIRFDDVDGAGIVYYPQYFHICHAAFEDFFDQAAHISYPDLITIKKRGFPTVALESQFMAPLKYGDTAIVKVGIRQLGNSSVAFGYEIRRKSDGTLCFTAKVTTVMLDIDTMQSIAIPEEYRKLFTRFLESS